MSKKPNARSSRRPGRPKSVFAKGWATRRRNQERAQREAYKASVDAELKSMGVPGNPVMGETNADPRNPNVQHQQAQTLVFGEANQASPIPPSSPSVVNAVENTLRIARDEQLCCFLGDIATLRQMHAPTHAPILISRSQAEAIEEFLTEYGFSMFGRQSRPTPKAA